MFTDWTRGEILSLIAVVYSALGTFANAAALRWVFLKRVLVGSALVITIVTAFVLGWLVRRDDNTVVDKPLPSPRRPGPKATPTPAPTPAPVPRDFQVVPENPQAIKSQYCVVADFKGSLVPNANSIEVQLTEANLDLCRFSNHFGRRISIRVGVSSLRDRRVAWSSRKVVAELDPGESFTLSTPLRLAISKRMQDLSRAVVSVEVENRPSDTGRPYRYLMTAPMDQVSSN